MTSLSAVTVINDAGLTAAVNRCLSNLPVRVLFEAASVSDWEEFGKRLEAVGPELLFIDLGVLNEPIEKVFERLNKLDHPPAVIAVHVEAQSDVILRTIRAGAIEYCNPPIEAPLRAAIEKQLKAKAESAPARGSGKVFGFLSAKGGCGATTIACHVAAAMPSLIEDKVLLADLDLNGGMVGFLLKAKSQYSIAHAMQNSHRMDLSFWKAIVSNGIPKLEVLSAPPPSAQRQPYDVSQIPSVLEFTRSVYGATIVDLGRFLPASAMAAIEEIDKTLIVSTLDVLALHQARKIVESMLDAGYARERLGIVLNRITNQRELEPDEVEKLLGVPVLAVLPDDSASLHEAYPEGKLLAADSPLYLRIVRLARTLAGVPEPEKKKKFLFFGD